MNTRKGRNENQIPREHINKTDEGRTQTSTGETKTKKEGKQKKTDEILIIKRQTEKLTLLSVPRGI